MLHDDLTQEILAACMEVHNQLGHGFLEYVYQEALEKEFIHRSIPFEREKALNIFYKGQLLRCQYNADFLVAGSIILELKALNCLQKEHKAQVINYLKASKCSIGLLVNFGAESLKWERISSF